jgi:GxxExxY protein
VVSDSETRDPQTYAIIGAAMEVHQQLGHGFLKAVYHQAMMLELARGRFLFNVRWRWLFNTRGKRFHVAIVRTSFASVMYSLN